MINKTARKATIILTIFGLFGCNSQTEHPVGINSFPPPAQFPMDDPIQPPTPPEQPPTPPEQPMPTPESVCGLESLSEAATKGTVYYFCNCAQDSTSGCQAGEDIGNYTSPSNPGKTIAEAVRKFKAMQAGDTIALCRGGIFKLPESAAWVNSKCDKDKRCTVRAYDPPWSKKEKEAKPYIFGGIDVADGGSANQEQGYNFVHLRLEGPDDETGKGIFAYNDIDHSLFCDLEINNFRLGVHVARGHAPASNNDGKNSYLTFKNLKITNSFRQGFLGGCDHCVIENSYFENNGFSRPTLDHNMYIAGDTTGMRIVGNELYQSTKINGRCNGASLVVHGKQKGLLIENNLVREDLDAVEPGCWGISVNPGYKNDPESFTDVIIRNNTVVNVGNVSISVTACSDCIIENNVIIQEQSLASRAILAPDRERQTDDTMMNALMVMNNSIYFGRTTSGIGISVGSEGSGHSIVNNAIQYDGEDIWNCLELDLPDENYKAVNHNLCYYPNTQLGSWSQGYRSLNEWKTRGLGLYSISGDPLFNSIEAGNFDLSTKFSHSPLVDNGYSSLYSKYDKNGILRDNYPDIGAYEMVK